MELLKPDSLPLALSQVARTRQLQPGQCLFRQGDPVTGFYILTSGRLRILRHTLDGDRILLEILGAGETLGESALFSESYTCSAIAETLSQVILFGKPEVLALLPDHPELAECLMGMMAQKTHTLKRRLELRAIRAAHRRVLYYFQYLCQTSDLQESVPVVLDRPLKDVAADLSLTPETLSRALARLEKEGLITRAHDQILVRQRSSAA